MTLAWDEISYCGREIILTDIICTPITIVILIFRFWSARISGRRISADDVFVILAFLTNGVLTGFGSWGAANGLGHHIIELTRSQVTDQVTVLLVAEFVYLLGTAWVKMSMLFLLHRIYTTPTFRRWCYVLMGLDAAYIITSIPLFLTNCIPLSQYWDPKPTGWCRNPSISDNVTIAYNLLIDFGILILPLPVLWRLQMSLRDKVTVTAMFGFGFVTIGLVIWRLVETIKIRATSDLSSSVCKVGEIATLEIHIGIVGVCIPTLGPLFNAHVRPALSKIGITKKSMRSSALMIKNPDLETFGGSNSKSNKRSQRHTDFTLDRTLNGDEPEKYIPASTEDVKIVSECAFEPANEGHRPQHIQNGIRVQKDFDTVYQPKEPCKNCGARQI
ncbi:hypothetical protein F4861DRAFT_121761 [Xylaria intraflava]|nr:hypothetical protein F4861DRAFT_121761 [Xylaria intraflava]